MRPRGKIAVVAVAAGPRADAPPDRAKVIAAASSHPDPGEAGFSPGIEPPLGGGRTA